MTTTLQLLQLAFAATNQADAARNILSSYASQNHITPEIYPHEALKAADEAVQAAYALQVALENKLSKIGDDFEIIADHEDVEILSKLTDLPGMHGRTSNAPEHLASCALRHGLRKLLEERESDIRDSESRLPQPGIYNVSDALQVLREAGACKLGDLHLDELYRDEKVIRNEARVELAIAKIKDAAKLHNPFTTMMWGNKEWIQAGENYLAFDEEKLRGL